MTADPTRPPSSPHEGEAPDPSRVDDSGRTSPGTGREAPASEPSLFAPIPSGPTLHPPSDIPPKAGSRPGTEAEDDLPASEHSPDDLLFAGRYVLGPLLGRGGTCSVYRAWDTRLQRHVAIKRLEPPLTEDEHARARFHREGKAIARLSHPHLVTLIDRGATDSDEYLVFQYIQGRSLKEVIRTTGPMDPEDVGRIIGQVAEGLAHAHSMGIVHRDVKPQNILLDAEGRAKLTDFGIATGTELTKVTREGSIVGSSRYMSPEQVQARPIDARTDVYSLGIVMYEMLAGQPPFQGTSMVEVGRQHVRERPAPLRSIRPDIPENVDRVVLHCLEKLPESRFQSMEELLGALVGLDLYEPEPIGGGLLHSLRRGGRSRDLDADSEWVPPPGTEPPPPEIPLEVLQAAAMATGTRDETVAGEERLRRADVMRSRRRRGGSRRWVQAAVAIGLVAVLVLVILLLTGSTKAPDLVGRSLDEARDLAATSGVQLEIDSEQVMKLDQPAGTVLSQDPAAGADVEGDVIQVVVSREPVAVPVAELDDYDPQGDDQERPDLLPQLTDGEEGTGWSTESYRGANFGNLDKTGVGIDFVLESPATLLEVVSPSEGWTGQVLVASGDSQDLTPVADLTGSERQSIDLGGPVSRGRIWITSLAPAEDNRYLVQLAELRFFR